MGTVSALYEQTLEYLLAPVQPYLNDDSISEVMINGHKEVFVESGGRLTKTDAEFENAQALEAAARNIAQFVGKRLTPESPSIEARLPDGSRVHIVQEPAARNGLCIAIRKFSKNKLDLAKLVEFGALSEEAAEFLSVSVGLAKNIIVSGGTGSGKTTLLNCLSAMIQDGERILVLEDSSELQLQRDHVVSFEAQPPDRNGRGGVSIRDLFRASLRMRPDRIVVGECRGGEALDMIQAMTSGHSGSMSTCHANSPYDGCNRVETMALMGDVGMPLVAIRAQVASAIDLIVQISRFHDGSRKITNITEVLGLENGAYNLADIYQLQHSAEERSLKYTGTRPTFATEPYLHDFANRIKFTKNCWQQPGGN